MIELKDAPSVLHPCPNCDKLSLAQVGNDRFTCLWCGFHRNISRSNGLGGDTGGVFFALLVISALVIILIG